MKQNDIIVVAKILSKQQNMIMFDEQKITTDYLINEKKKLLKI